MTISRCRQGACGGEVAARIAARPGWSRRKALAPAGRRVLKAISGFATSWLMPPLLAGA